MRHAHQVRDAEQHEELLADAGLEVLLDLLQVQRAVVDRDQADHARPLAVVADFVAEHEGEAVVPVAERAAAGAVEVAGELAVHVDAAAVDRVEGHHDVLQRSLQALVRVRGRQLRRAVGTGLGAAAEEVVVVHRLAHREVAGRRAAGVADDARVFLRHVARHDPRFDGVLAGRSDQLMELAARGRRGLRLAGADVDAPAADPRDVAAQREVRRRIDAAGVERGAALAALELVERDQVVLVAVAAGGDRAVEQRQRLAGDQVRIDLRRRGSRRPSSGSRPASPRRSRRSRSSSCATRGRDGSRSASSPDRRGSSSGSRPGTTPGCRPRRRTATAWSSTSSGGSPRSTS